MSRPQRVADMEAVATELAAEIGNVVRNDGLLLRDQQRSGGSEVVVEDLASLVRQFCGPSVDEIDRAIIELQAMRDVVRNEGERIEREVADYVSMTRTATASTKVIVEGLAKWRSALAPKAA
jgi:hypothetical protein